jgi:CHAD domain-containing protein
VRRQVRRAGRRPSATQLHQIRIKSKQLRYAAEAATPVIGKPAQRTASAAEDVQTVLGKHHDAVAAEAWLRDEWVDQASGTTSVTISPAVCFEVGRLVAEAHHIQGDSADQWADAWAELRKPKRLRWLSGR